MHLMIFFFVKNILNKVSEQIENFKKESTTDVIDS